MDGSRCSTRKLLVKDRTDERRKVTVLRWS
jgi:hypothetical protein